MRKTNQNEPINKFLKENLKRHPVSFHMPGHKYGKFALGENKKIYGSFDITEIPGADNIKKPNGIIKDSLEEISCIYGSLKSFYLTNGTTSGIHAIIRYAALNGKKIILSRDCHISAVNGAILFGVDTAFIPIEIEGGIPLPVSASAVLDAVSSNPEACGVLLTSPNYYGKTAHISEIAKIVHSRGMFLAIDEAHGSHFQFAGIKHKSGINCGADIVCHSLHKTLPVYNQGAVIHVCSDIINIKQIGDAVNILGTTSPSYPLMASMEKAVVYFNENGERSYRILKRKLAGLKNKVELIKNCKIIETDDFSRIIIKTGINGQKAAEILHDKFNIDVEAADFNHIICISTPFNTKNDFIKLSKALLKIGSLSNSNPIENSVVPDMPKKEIPLVEAYLSRQKTVSVDMAKGYICGTIIVSYPPGTPLVCPGEIIDGYTVEYIKKVINAGGYILGIEDNKIPVLELT